MLHYYVIIMYFYVFYSYTAIIFWLKISTNLLSRIPVITYSYIVVTSLSHHCYIIILKMEYHVMMSPLLHIMQSGSSRFPLHIITSFLTKGTVLQILTHFRSIKDEDVSGDSGFRDCSHYKYYTDHIGQQASSWLAPQDRLLCSRLWRVTRVFIHPTSRFLAESLRQVTVPVILCDGPNVHTLHTAIIRLYLIVYFIRHWQTVQSVLSLPLSDRAEFSRRG